MVFHSFFELKFILKTADIWLLGYKDESSVAVLQHDAGAADQTTDVGGRVRSGPGYHARARRVDQPRTGRGQIQTPVSGEPEKRGQYKALCELAVIIWRSPKFFFY